MVVYCKIIKPNHHQLDGPSIVKVFNQKMKENMIRLQLIIWK